MSTAPTPHQNPSDDALRTLLTKAQTIAVIGASSNPERASYEIIERLLGVPFRQHWACRRRGGVACQRFS